MKAIDIHLHAGFGGATVDAMKDTAETYRKNDVLGLPIAWDEETRTGRPPISNDFVADCLRAFPDVFPTGWACVDPWKAKAAVLEIERAVKELGLIGVKFQAAAQEFFANDRRFYPLYEKCVELEVPLLLHSGMTGIGANLPGGGGIKFKYCRPIPYVDDVAADFPDLTIIMAHPAFPWVEEQLAIVVHKPNVYMDLSGWSPKYFDPLLVQYANTRIQDKVLFGSDYAAITPERWLADFEAAPFRDEVRPKILLENAKRVLNLDL